MLHGNRQSQKELDAAAEGKFASLVSRDEPPEPAADNAQDEPERANDDPDEVVQGKSENWASDMRILLLCFSLSGLYTVCTYFFPVLRNLPIFGSAAASTWLWTLNPSFAYIGQGIIMGAETTMHMTLGAVVGWAILSPLAKSRGWAPGPVGDWESGSKGWIVWVSLAIMLVDAVVSLAYVALHPLIGKQTAVLFDRVAGKFRQNAVGRFLGFNSHEYSLLRNDDADDTASQSNSQDDDNLGDSDNKEDFGDDAPKEQRVTTSVVSVGLVLSILVCVLTIHLVFGNLVPLYATIIAVFMALVLSIMGVRALGETDLNPVSGISKLAQLFFALIIPQNHQSSVLINLVAGAVVSIRPTPLPNLEDCLKLTRHLFFTVRGCKSS